MTDLFKQFFPPAILLIGFTFFFVFLFLSTIYAIANASKAISQEIHAASPPTTQLGALLPLFSPTPTVTSEPLPTPIQVQPASYIVPEAAHPITAADFPEVDPTKDAVWERLAYCESGGRWNTDTGNSFYGGLQFTLGTWAGVGGVGKPSDASKEEQIYRAKILQSRRGWGPWPACSRKLGLL